MPLPIGMDLFDLMILLYEFIYIYFSTQQTACRLFVDLETQSLWNSKFNITNKIIF